MVSQNKQNQNNITLYYIVASNTIYHKIEVINSLNIIVFHHCHGSVLTAKITGYQDFKNLKHLQNLDHFSRTVPPWIRDGNTGDPEKRDKLITSKNALLRVILIIRENICYPKGG